MLFSPSTLSDHGSAIRSRDISSRPCPLRERYNAAPRGAATTIIGRTEPWGRLLPHTHSPTTVEPSPPRSDDVTDAAASSTSISRSRDVRRLSGTHRRHAGIDCPDSAAVSTGELLRRTLRADGADRGHRPDAASSRSGICGGCSPGTPPTTTRRPHRALQMRPPRPTSPALSRSLAVSGVDRSWAGSSTSTRRPLETPWSCTMAEFWHPTRVEVRESILAGRRDNSLTSGFAPPTGLEPVTTRKIDFSVEQCWRSSDSARYQEQRARGVPLRFGRCGTMHTESHA